MNMTDGQFYTFIGLAVVSFILLYDVARLLTHMCRGLDRVNHSIGVLQVVVERANTDTQQRVFNATAAADRASSYLAEIAQPIREAKSREERARFGL